MADNLNVTPGSGAVVAADDVSGALYQRVKVGIGADGVSEGDISETNPIPSRITGRWIDVTLTLDTNIYGDGDVLADTQVISGVSIGNDKIAKLKSVVVVDKDDQGYPFAIMLFDSNVSFGTENSAPSLSDVDGGSYLGKVEIGTLDYDDVGGVRIARIECDVPIKPVSGTDDIYIAVLSRGTGTYSANGIILRFYFE